MVVSVGGDVRFVTIVLDRASTGYSQEAVLVLTSVIVSCFRPPSGR